MSEQTRILPAVSDMTLDHEMFHYGKVKEKHSWYENHYHLVMGEMADHDFLLITSLILLKGPPDGYNMIEDGASHYTSFFMLPQSQRGSMADNDFIHGGCDPQEYLKASDFKLTRESDRVVLEAQNREYIARPPYWEVHGSHMGVDLDLLIHGIHPGFWYLGPFEALSEHGRAGVDHYTQAEGTITVGGKKHEISRAGGLHEHVVLVDVDQVGAAKGVYHWLVGWADYFQFFLFYMPGWQQYYGRVIVDNKSIDYSGEEQITLKELEYWEDPRSHCMITSKWHLTMSAPEGVLDVNIANGGRFYYVNSFSNGYLARYWTLGFANGSVRFRDGRDIPIENLRIGTDRSWAFHVIQPQTNVK